MFRHAFTALMSALLVLACTAAPTATESPPPQTPARLEDAEGRYRLLFEMPSTTWAAGQPIQGTATLQLLEGDVAQFSGSGGGPFAFRYVEVNGDRRVEPVWTADCARHQLRAAEPLTTGLTKSGAYGGDDPHAAFLQDFLRGPDVRLPAGPWDITAIGSFVDGEDCSGPGIDLEATIRITVVD